MLVVVVVVVVVVVLLLVLLVVLPMYEHIKNPAADRRLTDFNDSPQHIKNTSTNPTTKRQPNPLVALVDTGNSAMYLPEQIFGA